MTVSYGANSRHRGRRQNSQGRLAPLLFFLVGCLLLTLAGTIFGAWYLFRNTDTTDAFAWKAPHEQVDNRTLEVETVLLPLTGIDSADVLNATLDKAHLENAYALLAYDPSLSDAARTGALLQLGVRFARANKTAKASSCFQSAALLATLSPELADQARMDTYQQASNGLRGIGATALARLITDQAYIVAQSSPALKGDARARRLDQVADAYTALGASSLAAQARQKSLDAAGATTQDPGISTRVSFNPASGKLPASPELDATITTRVAAAKQLEEDLINLPAGTTAWPSDSLTQLGDALSVEDIARQAYYDKQIPQAKDIAVKLALMRDRVNWLALKYRIARGAFGQSLVADWSKDPVAILDTWGDAWADLFGITEQQAAVVVKPQNPTQATEDVVREELIASRWGWYNRVTEQDITGKLSDVTQQLMNSATSALRVDTISRSGKTMFLLVPDDLYGQGDKALPK